MPKQVRALERRSQAGPFERPGDDTIDAGGTGKTTKRRPYPKEETSCPPRWANIAEIFDQCLADVRWQRQTGQPLAFAPNDDVAVRPVEVIERQDDNLASA